MARTKLDRPPPFIAREIVVTHHGRRVTVRHRPSDYPWRALGSELADALVDRAHARDLAKDTLRTYVKVIRDFCLFMGQREGIQPHGLGQTDDAISEGIYAWSKHLRQHHSPQSKVPNRYVGALCSLIIDHADAGCLVGPTTLTRAQAGSLIPRGRDIEGALPPFSNKERLLIREQARRNVRQLEQRLQVGSSLLRDAHDPLHDRFPAVRSMLRALASGTEPDLQMDALGSIAWPTETLELHYRDRVSGQRTALRRLSSLLGPMNGDLQGFRVLLMQASGWAPEEVHDLLISETTDVVTGRIYTRRKARAGYVKEEPIPHGKSSEWNFNGLIDRLLRATEIIRPLADLPTQDWYFLTASWESGRPAVGVASFHSGKSAFSQWASQNGLDLTAPLDIRRIRKTARTIRTMQAATLEDAAGDEHTAETYNRHYFPSPTTKVLAAHVLRSAQDGVLSSVRSSGPTVVAMAAEEALVATALSAPVVSAAFKEDGASEVDKALLPVTCRDEFDSPFGERGGLCPSMVSHCLVCPNAFIFEDHVPRIAAYEKILGEYQCELSPPEFLDRYELAQKNVAAVMAAMDPQVVAAARAAVNPDVLQLPIDMKVSLR